MSLILLVSILIRLAAMGWSVVLWRRIRDWRMGFLTVMLLLMASRQILTLSQTARAWVPDLGQKTELPGLLVSVMALLAVFFLERMLGEKKRAEAEREQLIRELESRMAELERFSYAVSHDLKSPLVTIKGFLPLLERDLAAGDGDSGAHDIERIRQAADRMGQLLSQLQDLSRLSHSVELSDEASLGELAEECVALLAERIERNAIRERRYHEKIFGLFERVGRDGRGTGVGLALARRIVELHGGRIWVESEGERLRSTFCFTLAPGSPCPPTPGGGAAVSW